MRAAYARVNDRGMLTGGVHRTRRLLAAVAIVARHVLGYLFGLLRPDRFVTLGHGRSRAGGPTRRTGPEHVRLAVEELGVASIKIGQILSTRTDLLAPAYQVELAKLQDSAPPEPTAVITDVLVTELGAPIDTVFAVFDRQPMAAASIGQVHAATLHDGSEVIVKIRRPGVVEQIELDLQMLEATVRPITRFSRAARRYDLRPAPPGTHHRTHPPRPASLRSRTRPSSPVPSGWSTRSCGFSGRWRRRGERLDRFGRGSANA